MAAEIIAKHPARRMAATDVVAAMFYVLGLLVLVTTWAGSGDCVVAPRFAADNAAGAMANAVEQMRANQEHYASVLMAIGFLVLGAIFHAVGYLSRIYRCMRERE